MDALFAKERPLAGLDEAAGVALHHARAGADMDAAAAKMQLDVEWDSWLRAVPNLLDEGVCLGSCQGYQRYPPGAVKKAPGMDKVAEAPLAW